MADWEFALRKGSISPGHRRETGQISQAPQPHSGAGNNTALVREAGHLVSQHNLLKIFFPVSKGCSGRSFPFFTRFLHGPKRIILQTGEKSLPSIHTVDGHRRRVRGGRRRRKRKKTASKFVET